MTSWFSQTPNYGATNNTNVTVSEPPKTSFFDTVKAAVKFNASTTNESVVPPVDDPESTSLMSKFKNTLNPTNIISKSKSFVQGTSESMQTSINLAKNLPYIIVLCVGGTFFMFLAFMFLPAIIVFPEKFSFSFALGSLCFFGAASLLRDPKTFFLGFLKGGKLFYTIIYLVALLGTFYFSLISQSKICALIFALAQIVSLMWLLASSIPGGTAVVGTIQSAVVKCCKSCTMMIFRSATNTSSGTKSFLPM